MRILRHRLQFKCNRSREQEKKKDARRNETVTQKGMNLGCGLRRESQSGQKYDKYIFATFQNLCSGNNDVNVNTLTELSMSESQKAPCSPEINGQRLK